MRIDVPGNGISFSVPVDSIGGTNTLRYMTDGQHNLTSEVTEMNEAPYELIVAIANQGSNELVMDAAKSAGRHGRHGDPRKGFRYGKRQEVFRRIHRR